MHFGDRFQKALSIIYMTSISNSELLTYCAVCALRYLFRIKNRSAQIRASWDKIKQKVSHCHWKLLIEKWVGSLQITYRLCTLKLGQPYIDLMNYLQSFSPLCVKKKKKKMKTRTRRRHLNTSWPAALQKKTNYLRNKKMLITINPIHRFFFANKIPRGIKGNGCFFIYVGETVIAVCFNCTGFHVLVRSERERRYKWQPAKTAKSRGGGGECH